MLKTLSSAFTKKHYLKRNRITYESINTNLEKCIDKHLKLAEQKKTPITTKVEVHHDPTKKADFRHIKFKFKNLVLADGAANGVAYCGAAMALEEHRILKDINRFAGTGAGALVAVLLYVGFSPNHVQTFMENNMKGLSSAKNIWKLLGEQLQTKTGNPDINFQQIFEKCKKELCIVVPSGNGRSDEYYHLLTTPYTPIRDAVQISFPVKLQSCSEPRIGRNSLHGKEEALFNYPIHCFDGPKLHQMDTIEQVLDPFTIHDRILETLGCVVYSEEKYDSLRYQIEQKCKVPRFSPPNTELFREWKRKQQQKDFCRKFYLQCIKHQTEFLRIFYQGCIAQTEFSMDQFKQKLRKAWDDDEKQNREGKVSCYSARTYAKTIYGENVDEGMIFKSIEKSDEGKVTRPEILLSAKEIGSILFQRYQDNSSDLKGKDKIMGFDSSIVTGHRPEENYSLFNDEDVERTVGINTWYINPFDFAMAKEDINFLLDQGKYSTVEFLKRFVLDHNLTEDTVLRSGDGLNMPSIPQQDKNIGY